jgi:ABC-2 type transport system permease protein
MNQVGQDGVGLNPPPSPAPQAHEQWAAVADLRWRMLINSLRKPGGRLELASRIFISLAFLAGGVGGAVGLGGAAWFLTSQGNPEWLVTLLWPVFLFWQLFPVMATAFVDNLDSSSLLRFPLSYRSYFLIRLADGSLDPATTVASLCLLGITLGIGAAEPGLLPWTTLVLLMFAMVNLLLARTLFSWLERWLAQRRTREIMGVLFVIFILSFQLAAPLIAAYGHKAKPEARLLGQELSRVQRPLPPGLAADAIAETMHGRPGAGLFSLLWLGLYGALFLGLLHFRLRAEYRGENLSESYAGAASRRQALVARPGWRVAGLPGPVAAVFEKELRYLGRSGPMLFTLLVPMLMLLIFRSSGQRGGPFAQLPDLTFPIGAAYVLLLLTNLTYNNLGGDGRGIQFWFASPARFPQILAGKNLAHAAIFILEVVLLWLGTCLIYRTPPLPVTLATIACMLFVVPIDLAAGNLLSLYCPTRIEAGVFGRQRASLTTVLTSFAVRGVLFSAAVLLFWLSRQLKDTWMAIAVCLGPAVLAWSVYAFGLSRTDQMALDHRENLIAQLGRQ